MGELPLLRPNKQGKAPKERLANPKSLRDIFVLLHGADEVSAYNRGLAQALLDGEPPFNQGELDLANQSGTTNLNFQGAAQKLDRAMSPYYKLLHGSDLLMSVKTLFGAEDERADLESIMAEEITSMIRRWSRFPYETERTIFKHVWEGMGIFYWPDGLDWRPRSGGLGQFYFPRQEAATEDEQEVIIAREDYSITRLYRMIEPPDVKKAPIEIEAAALKKGNLTVVAKKPEGEESAEENEQEPEKEKASGSSENESEVEGYGKGEGDWNRQAVLDAIAKAASSDSAYRDQEVMLDEIKNNDLVANAKLPKIKILHGFVQEFDGTVSHYITTEDDTGDKFLYVARGTYSCMAEALVLFPYSISTNTKIHGIRGLGYKVYPFEQQRNRSIGRMIDKGMEASSTMVQATSEESMTNIGLEYFGNLSVLSPGVNVVTPNAVDLTRSVEPALILMERLGNDRAAAYSPENVFGGDQRKTKFEVAAHLDQSAALSDSSMDFFYGPWRRVLQQIIRRITRRDYVREDPGGREVFKLRAKLLLRGVPLEAFFKLDADETQEVRIIGAGSPAAKTMALDRMGNLYGRMDDVAKHNYDRDVSVDTVGPSNAGRYFPVDNTRRTTLDTQIAILQNDALLRGVEQPVLGTDKHLAHAREHIQPLTEMYQAVEGGQADLAESATTHRLLYAHTVEHVEKAQGDESSQEEINALQQMLQRIGEVISNGLKQAEAQQQKAAEEQAMAQQQGGGAPGEMPDVEQTERALKAKAEIELMQERADVENRIKEQNAEVQRRIQDADAAADIKRKAVKEQAHTAIETQGKQAKQQAETVSDIQNTAMKAQADVAITQAKAEAIPPKAPTE